METNTLSGEIKAMSEEIADKIANAFKEANEAQKDLNGVVNRMARDIPQAILQDAASEYMSAALHYAEAPFFLKWYWKRKTLKASKNFDRTSKAVRDFEKEFAAWQETTKPKTDV